MSVRFVTPAVVELEGVLRVQPAGLFRYQVSLTKDVRSFTLWCQFGKTRNGERAVLFYVNSAPTWDDGYEVQAEEAILIFRALEKAFQAKGYRVFTSILHPESSPLAEVDELQAITETEHGALLDEVSALAELSDVVREYFCRESKAEFRRRYCN